MTLKHLIILILAIAAFALIFNALQKDKEELAKQEEWCEVGTVNPDGSITYNGEAGTTELIAFATVNGPKLMAKCK